MHTSGPPHSRVEYINENVLMYTIYGETCIYIINTRKNVMSYTRNAETKKRAPFCASF